MPFTDFFQAILIGIAGTLPFILPASLYIYLTDLDLNIMMIVVAWLIVSIGASYAYFLERLLLARGMYIAHPWDQVWFYPFLLILGPYIFLMFIKFLIVKLMKI